MPDAAAIDAEFTPVIAGGTASVVLDGEIVLYHEQTGRVHALNTTASIVWQLIDGRMSVGELATEIARELGADAGVVMQDVVALVRMFGEIGVLEGVDPASVEPPSP